MEKPREIYLAEWQQTQYRKIREFAEWWRKENLDDKDEFPIKQIESKWDYEFQDWK